MATSGKKKVVRRKKKPVAKVITTEALQAALQDAGIVAPGITPSEEVLRGRIAIVRCGKAIAEETILVDGNPDIVFYNVDAEAELEARGHVHNGMTDFSIEYYLRRQGGNTYADLEELLLSDRRFADAVFQIRLDVFTNLPAEREGWESSIDSTKLQPVDMLGGGGLVYNGVLRVLSAVQGRRFEPNPQSRDGSVNFDYDPRDDAFENPHLPQRADNVMQVSLLSDLVAAFKRDKIKVVVIVGGFDGATGSSCLIVLTKLLTPIKSFSTIPLCMVALPEYFLVEGVVPAVHADRLNALLRILGRGIAMAAMGQDGIVWKVIADHVRTWGGLYSNVFGLSKVAEGRRCAPVLTIAAVPRRKDLETRFFLGLMALSDMNPDKAREVVLEYTQPGKKSPTVLKAVPYKNDVGVEVTVKHSHHLLIHEWQQVMPALTTCQRNIGRMTLPVEYRERKTVRAGLFGMGTAVKQVPTTGEKPVQSVPLLSVLMKGVGADQVADLNRHPEAFALLVPEKRLVGDHLMVTFEQAFEAIERDFLALVTEILLKGLFEHKVYNPTIETYAPESADDKIPHTVVAWGIIDVGSAAYADHLFSHVFAKVDRSAEETARLAEAEHERERVVQQLTAQALQEVFAVLGGGGQDGSA